MHRRVKAFIYHQRHTAVTVLKRIMSDRRFLVMIVGLAIAWLGSVRLSEYWERPAKEADSTATPSAVLGEKQEIDPLRIEYLHHLTLDQSELVIEETLAPAYDHDHYIVSFYSEGLKQFGLLTVPNGELPEGGWPALIFNHGDIPPDEYRTDHLYGEYIDYFVRRGYVVLKPDYRGHGESEGKAINAYAVPDYTIDVLNALAALKRYPDINPEKIGMWGHSTGGHITLRAMVVEPSIKAGVIWGGVVGSYQELIELWPSYWQVRNQPTPEPDPNFPEVDWRTYLVHTYGSFEKNKEDWDAISATSFLDQLSGPVQLHHSETDEWVPVELSKRLHHKIEAVGKPSQLYVYEHDNHNLHQNFSTAMQRSLAFFNLHLGVEDTQAD